MKRSTAITLALLGAGGIAVYGASQSSCQSDDWNDAQSCRSPSSSHWIHFGGYGASDSAVSRGGFGKSGFVHGAGG
jgi:hypothetical protein